MARRYQRKVDAEIGLETPYTALEMELQTIYGAPSAKYVKRRAVEAARSGRKFDKMMTDVAAGDYRAIENYLKRGEALYQ
jgi:hypothetical protein